MHGTDAEQVYRGIMSREKDSKGILDAVERQFDILKSSARLTTSISVYSHRVLRDKLR